MQNPCKKIKLTIKPEEDMKPLSKINEDPEHYRTRFSGPVVYDEALSQINAKAVPAIDWEKKGLFANRVMCLQITNLQQRQ